jgi:prolyl 4-hydroxylase
MIYLNEDFAGGETTFPEWDVCITPKTGMMLLFRHELLHAGEAVTRGRKYVLRSDVMYSA